jgi:hypothetical protein
VPVIPPSPQVFLFASTAQAASFLFVAGWRILLSPTRKKGEKGGPSGISILPSPGLPLFFSVLPSACRIGSGHTASKEKKKLSEQPLTL